MECGLGFVEGQSATSIALRDLEGSVSPDPRLSGEMASIGHGSDEMFEGPEEEEGREKRD